MREKIIETKATKGQEMTHITTTAELWGDKARIEHLNKLPDYIKKDIVEINCSAGTHYYYFDETWKVFDINDFGGKKLRTEK